MWQRIQTVFLTITFIALITALFQPIWVQAGMNTQKALTPFYFTDGETHHYMPYSITAILIIAAATVAITSIRKYKNRVLQMKLGAFMSLLLVGVIACSAYFAMDLIKQFNGGRYGLAFYLPVAAVLCNLLSNFFIRRDERLVRDSERLR